MTEELRKKLELVEQERERLMKLSKERLVAMAISGNALWDYVYNIDICLDDYTIIDRYEFPIDKYSETCDGIIRTEMYNILDEKDGIVYEYELKEEYKND
tara:strand:+ start:1091 stop:1390 length:300 start_codon:yes stop_codon:yes gene_type:complete